MFLLRILKKIYQKFRGTEWFMIHNHRKIFEKAGYSMYIKKHCFHVDGNGLHITSNKSDKESAYGTAIAVLLSRDYNFSMTEPYVMFDIGFNIGVTSLYWARNEYVKQIYGFEPFKPTWEEGRMNLENNPELAKKIKAFNFGLSDTDKNIEVHYALHGNVGMSTKEDKLKGTKNCGNIERAQVKKASEVLKPLFEKHTEKKFLKIDCEGSEFEILPDLDKTGLLKDVSVIIMEWHDNDPKILVDLLTKNDFNVYCMHAKPEKMGMIVAFKK